MGKMVMSDMFDQDELDQVKAALVLKGQVDLKNQQEAMKMQLQKRAAAQAAPGQHATAMDEEVLFQVDTGTVVGVSSLGETAENPTSATQPDEKNMQKRIAKLKQGVMDVDIKQVDERKQKVAKAEGLKQNKSHHAKKQSAAGKKVVKKAKYDAEKAEHALQEKSWLSPKVLQEKMKQEQAPQKAVLGKATKPDTIGQLNFRIKNLENQLSRSRDKAKVAWNRKGQEDKMLQKMEVEAHDRQAQANKMYEHDLNEEGGKMQRAQMASKDAQRSLELCQRRLKSVHDSDEKKLSKSLDKGLKKLNSVHLTSNTGKVKYEFAKATQPVSKLCQACAKLTPGELSTLNLECGTCMPKKKKAATKTVLKKDANNKAVEKKVMKKKEAPIAKAKVQKHLKLKLSKHPAH